MVLIYVGFSRVYDTYMVGLTCEVVDIGHMRSHLHDIGRTSTIRDDVRPSEFLQQILGDG